MSDVPNNDNPPADRNVPLPVAEPEGSRWGRAHHVLLAFVAVAFVVWLCTGAYQIGASEQGLVERIGQLVSNDQQQAILVGTGLHYGLPWPLDIIHKIPVSEARLVTVSDFNTSTPAAEQLKREEIILGMPREAAEAFFDPYLVTSDKNVLNAQMTVQYRIKDPQAYFMSVAKTSPTSLDSIFADRDAMISHAAAHAMIRAMSRTKVDDALFEGKQRLVQALMELTQEEIARLNLGVNVETVNLEVVRWPTAVNEAFTGVIRARADATAAIDAARSDKTTMEDSASADVYRMLAEARAAASQAVAAATGEADRFGQVYTQYQAAPDITRMSLYADAVNTVLKNVLRTYYAVPGQRLTIVLDEPADLKKADINGNVPGQPPPGSPQR